MALTIKLKNVRIKEFQVDVSTTNISNKRFSPTFFLFSQCFIHLQSGKADKFYLNKFPTKTTE